MWLIVLRQYLIVSAAAYLVWEFAQLPLYTIWREATPAAIVFAAGSLHGRGYSRHD
jgi:hypothetical protein